MGQMTGRTEHPLVYAGPEEVWNLSLCQHGREVRNIQRSVPGSGLDCHLESWPAEPGQSAHLCRKKEQAYAYIDTTASPPYVGGASRSQALYGGAVS